MWVAIIVDELRDELADALTRGGPLPDWACPDKD